MFSRPLEEPYMQYILSWCVCTAYGCCTLKHENWKGQLARIGCRAHIMHKLLLDYFLLYFRQFNIKKPSDLYVYLTFFSKLNIQFRLSLICNRLLNNVRLGFSCQLWNLSIHVISEAAVSCLSLHSLWQ